MFVYEAQSPFYPSTFQPAEMWIQVYTVAICHLEMEKKSQNLGSSRKCSRSVFVDAAPSSFITITFQPAEMWMQVSIVAICDPCHAVPKPNCNLQTLHGSGCIRTVGATRNQTPKRENKGSILLFTVLQSCVVITNWNTHDSIHESLRNMNSVL